MPQPPAFNFIPGVRPAVILVVGKPQDALSGVVFVTNALIGIGQELPAKRTLDRLAALSAPRVRVIRDGTQRDIAVADLVAGDLVDLRAGEQLVADGVVRASTSLEADESLLTGESEPVDKRAGDRLPSAALERRVRRLSGHEVGARADVWLCRCGRGTASSDHRFRWPMAGSGTGRGVLCHDWYGGWPGAGPRSPVLPARGSSWRALAPTRSTAAGFWLAPASRSHYLPGRFR